MLGHNYVWEVKQFQVTQKMQQSLNKPKQMQVVAHEVHFILFVNTKSGDGYGSTYLKLGSNEIKIKYELSGIAHLFIFDLFQPESRNRGLSLVKDLSRDAAVDCRVIICGGDGTIPWVLSELLAIGVELESVVLGIIPIGTGNDFSRSLGWGSECPKLAPNHLAPLGSLVKQWMNSTIGFYDMWDVEVKTFEDGVIYDIKDQQENKRPENSFKKMFSNYVGMGLDARVVYTVQRHRTPIAFLNKVVYGLIGFLNFFRPMKRLQETVKSISESQCLDNYSKDDRSTQRRESLLNQNLIGEGEGIYPLKSGYCGIVCLNCTSYMAGLRKVWRTKSVSVPNKHHRDFSEQRVDDGKLEFVSFKTELNLALERIVRAGARAMQGSGPFQIVMKRPQQREITYMQIDGQSIKVCNLQSVRITKTSRIAGHRLRVMVNPNPIK